MLAGHGIICWADSAKACYDHTVALIADAAHMLTDAGGLFLALIAINFGERPATPQKTFGYKGEGWGLTQDGHRIIMSDGTPRIRFLDPETLKETGHIVVTDRGQPVINLNELEWVKGEIFANIWQTDMIARIDPKSGHVVGWIDLTGLREQAGAGADPDAVANGIAYDSAKGRLFVTGKLWPRLFEIRLVKKAGPAHPVGDPFR